MAFIVPDEIEQYAAEHTTPPTDLLAALAAETRETLDAPQMLTGTIEGRFLEMLVYVSGARRILEFGTYSGYSSISMAAGLPPGGEIHTCEIEEKHAEVARRYIEQAGLSDRITVHLGPGIETVERLGGEWNLVFIDADKPNYVNYYEATLPLLADGGLMVVDNTLWSGRVVDDDDQEDTTQAIRALNDHVSDDPRVENVLLTVRDGMNLVWRA